MDDDLYDEYVTYLFPLREQESNLTSSYGNYIGPMDEEAGEEGAEPVNLGDFMVDAPEDEEPEVEDAPADDQQLMEIDEGPSNAITLHEDKQYYPRAQEVYGHDVEIQVQEEDTQPLTQPIIAPEVRKKFSIEEEDLPKTFYSRDFMMDIMNYPEMIRNITIAGHLHHGKTAFMDMLVLETHDISDRLEKRRGKRRQEDLRYTDHLFLERERGLSIKASPMTLLLSSTKRKSYLFNIMDTPGHVNFADEVACSFRLSDGVVLVVDVIEGVQANTEIIIKNAIREELPLVLVVNKIDRLILELKLPPADAYFKIKHTIEEVNAAIEAASPGLGGSRRLSPEKGNVAFASATMGWCFTLQSYAKFYANSYEVDPSELALRLWGDIFYNHKKKTFTKKVIEPGSKRSFVSLVLEPIYKLYSHTISKDPRPLKAFLAKLGIELKPSQLKQDAKPLLKLVCQAFFGPCHGFVDMVIQHIGSPVDGAKRFVDKYYTGPSDNKTVKYMLKCDQSEDAPCIMNVTKMYNTVSTESFACFARVLSGVARPGQQIHVLGPSYSPVDDEELSSSTIAETKVAESRYNIPTSGVPAGNWVLLEGVDDGMLWNSTIVPDELVKEEEAYIFSPIRHFFDAVFKVAVEPLNPPDLPKMLKGLRSISQSYPLLTQKVEESGEHVLIGTGELFLDCALYDLRAMYTNVEVKVSDPVTKFCETVTESSAIQAYTLSPNKANKITFLAEPLDDGLAEDIEAGKININAPKKQVGKWFEENYGYDLLASRNIWAFGPGDQDPNILQNDTLPSEVDPKLLRSVTSPIIQGFKWSVREGPLCEEPIRNVKFRLTNTQLGESGLSRGAGQIIPTTRRACYSSMLLAQPRLMEPIYQVSMLGPADSINSVYPLLARRRGHVLEDHPVAGTPLFQIKGLLPVIDSFGFETDLRILTQGQATLSLVFDRWSIVPGDPLDDSIHVRPLEPATGPATARDFVMKTRRRKGLADDLSMSKYLDPEVFNALKEAGVVE
jgi:116 kDa U5 small nuclear ribonucleoprotein component